MSLSSTSTSSSPLSHSPPPPLKPVSRRPELLRRPPSTFFPPSFYLSFSIFYLPFFLKFHASDSSSFSRTSLKLSLSRSFSTPKQSLFFPQSFPIICPISRPRFTSKRTHPPSLENDHDGGAPPFIFRSLNPHESTRILLSKLSVQSISTPNRCIKNPQFTTQEP